MTIISITFSLIILDIILCYIKRCFCYFDDGLEVIFLLCLLCLHRQTLPNKNMHLFFVFNNNNNNNNNNDNNNNNNFSDNNRVEISFYIAKEPPRQTRLEAC